MNSVIRFAARFVFCVCSCALLKPLAVIAQEAPPADDVPVTLEPFKVGATTDIGYQSSTAAEVTRMNTAIANIPMNVTVINQQFIEDTVARSTADVLDYAPGFVRTSNNDDWVVRGFSNSNTNFMDGFPQSSSTGYVSVGNVERIEVLKGPAAVLYGQGGFGSTVNRVTKRPLSDRRTTLRGGYGPEDTPRFELDTTGPIDGAKKFLYRFNVTWHDGETYRKIGDQEITIAPGFTWKIGHDTKVTLEETYTKEKQGGAPWRMPVMNGNPRGFALPDGTFLSYGDNRQGYAAPGDYRKFTRQFQLADLQHGFSRNIQLRVQFARDTFAQDWQEAQPEQGSITLLKDAALIPRSWRKRLQDAINLHSRNELITNFKTGPADHRLLVGYIWEDYDQHQNFSASAVGRGGLSPTSPNISVRDPSKAVGTQFNQYPTVTLAQFLGDVTLAGYNPYLIPPVNVFNPADSLPPQAIANRTALYPKNWNHSKIGNSAFYLSELASFFHERFFLTGGVRHTATDQLATNNLLNTTQSSDVKKTTFSAGAVWHLTDAKTWTLYANANSSFVPEFRIQPDGSALQPQEGKQKEIGVRFNFDQNRFQGMVSLYDISQNNVTQPDSDPTRAAAGYFQQTSGLRSQGIELSLNARVTDYWSVIGGYAYGDARNEITGAAQMYAPKNTLTFYNHLKISKGQLKGFSAGLGTVYVGTRPIDTTTVYVVPGPIWTMPSYWRVDLNLGYDFRTADKVGYRLDFKIRNILDNNNIFILGDRDSMQPEDGRTFTVSLTAKF